MEIKLNKGNFSKELKTDKPVLVEFGATWCPPCNIMNPILHELANEMKNEVVIAKVDADESPELASKFSIQGLPSMLLFKNGNEVARMVGAASKAKLIQFIKNN